MRSVVKILLFVLMGFAVVGVIDSSTNVIHAAATSAPNHGGTLVVAVDQAPAGLDPHRATAFSSQRIVEQIYEGLVRFNSKLGIEPAIAESWDIQGKTTYIFSLRKGVRFHNGRELTADDVKYSFSRILDPKTGSYLASNFDSIKEIRVNSRYQVEFILKEPFAPFLQMLTTGYIVPKEVVEKEGDLQKVAVGTGPFKLKTLRPDAYILLEKNKDYYMPGLPYLDAVLFEIIPEASTRVASFKTRNVDMLPALDAVNVKLLARSGNRDARILKVEELAISNMGLNTVRAPLDDPRVRRAISYAIDRKQIVDAVYQGDGSPSGPLPPSLTQWALPIATFDSYSQDYAKARALLKEAGHPTGIRFQITVSPQLKVAYDIAQIIQEQLRPAGINVELKTVEWGQFIQDWKNGNFDAFVSIKGGSPDPDAYLYRPFLSTGSTNVYKYKNAKVDELLDEGRSLTDRAQRKSVYNQVQQLLEEESPVIHIACAELYDVLQPNVKGYEQMANRSLTYLRQTWLDK